MYGISIGFFGLALLYYYMTYVHKPPQVGPHPAAVMFDLFVEEVWWRVDFNTARVWRLVTRDGQANYVEYHMSRGGAESWSLRLSDHAWHALRQEHLTPNPVDGDDTGPMSDVGEAPDWKPCPTELQELLELRYQYLHSGYTHSTRYEAYAAWLQAPNQGYVDQPLVGHTPQQAPASNNVYAPPTDGASGT